MDIRFFARDVFLENTILFPFCFLDSPCDFAEEKI